MIRYALRCDSDHSFESWFQSADAFDALSKAGHLSCPICGSDAVSKALMAPPVAAKETPLSQAKTPAEQAMAELQKQVEENADYVGTEFAQEARAMHLGDVPHRPIWGEAKPPEAKALIEEGVPVAPLPIKPRRQTN